LKTEVHGDWFPRRKKVWNDLPKAAPDCAVDIVSKRMLNLFAIFLFN
jgi:hypothetical protein